MSADPETGECPERRGKANSMSIIRSARKERDFAILSNKLLQDSRLTMGALGVLVRLLSRPDNWETNSETLAREFNCGRDAVRTNLKKLQEVGYIKLFKSQDNLGRWSSVWMVFEDCDDSPETGNPNSGLPETGNPILGKSGALQRTDYKEPITTKEKPTKADYSALFDVFWKAYPKKVAKDAAYKAFSKRKPDDKLLKEILQAVESQKSSDMWTKDGGQYIPNPATWLNQGRWMDEIVGGSSGSPFMGGI